MRFFSVMHLWPGSLRVCIPNLNAFAWILALFLALLLFGKILHWSLAFVLCCFIFFCTRNGQIGCAVFVIAKITAFWAMFLDVSCAMFCCFICSVLQFLAFHVHFRCCLIFCSAFKHCLFDFLGRIPHCYTFCRAEVCLGVICWLCAIFLPYFASSCAPGFLHALIWQK